MVKSSALIKSMVKSGMITLVTLFFGVGGGLFWAKYFTKSVPVYAPWIQMASGALFLWAVLGLLGWEIQTYDGNSPVEKWNKWIFYTLNCLGMFFLFASSSALIFMKN